MIVVDSNIIAYCWLNTPMTGNAQDVRVKDSEWHVPVLWRAELRSIMTGYRRSGALSGQVTRRVMSHIEQELAGSEHIVPSDDVFAVVEACSLSAYDSEFVALALALSVPLVTEDKAILREFPRLAMSMAAFARNT